MGVGGREGARRVARPRASSQTYRGSGAASEICTPKRRLTKPRRSRETRELGEYIVCKRIRGFIINSCHRSAEGPASHACHAVDEGDSKARPALGIPIQVTRRFRHSCRKRQKGCPSSACNPALDLRRCETWSCDRLVAGPGSRPRPIPPSNSFTTHSHPCAPTTHPNFLTALPRAQTL